MQSAKRKGGPILSDSFVLPKRQVPNEIEDVCEVAAHAPAQSEMCADRAQFTDRLANENPHPRDGLISFRAGDHTYTLEHLPNLKLTSVTTLVHHYFPQFCAPTTAKKMISRQDFKTNTNYATYQPLRNSTPEDSVLCQLICDMWETNRIEQANRGTALHDTIEHAMNGFPIPEEKIERDREYGYAKRFLQDISREWVPWRSEWRIYDEETGVAGSIDAIYKHKTEHKFRMVDWKRSKKINRFAYDRTFGYPPFDRFPNSNFYHYTLQLNCYAYILKKNYGIEMCRMDIAVFHPDAEDAAIFEIDSCQDLITSVFEVLKTEIQAVSGS